MLYSVSGFASIFSAQFQKNATYAQNILWQSNTSLRVYPWARCVLLMLKYLGIATLFY